MKIAATRVPQLILDEDTIRSKIMEKNADKVSASQTNPHDQQHFKLQLIQFCHLGRGLGQPISITPAKIKFEVDEARTSAIMQN